MVPKGWAATEMGELANFRSGGTPSKQNSEYWGGIYPWVSAKDMKVHYLCTSIDRLTKEGFLNANVAPKGSSLVLVRGMTLLKDFPVAYVMCDLAFNQDVKALIPKKGIDPLFLSYLLVGNKLKIRQLVNTAGHGTGRLETEHLKEFPVYLPPEPEQTKIAHILSTWDKAIETVEKLIANSQQQKKALMQQLLTGRKRLLGFKKSWRRLALSEIATVTMGSSPKSEAYNKDSAGLPLIQGNADIKNRLSAPRIYTSEITKECKPKDILLSVRAPVGEIAKSLHHACIGRGICAIAAKDNNDQEFLYQWMLAFESKWESLSQGSTFESVNSDDIKSLQIYLPTNIEEQKRIASILASADDEIDVLKVKLSYLKQEKIALMQQLLTGKKRVKIGGFTHD